MPDQADVPTRGTTAAAISTATVQIMHEYTGRGPTKARTTINHDTVMVLMADTLLKAEQQLVADGKRETVLNLRHEFQGTMREDLVAAVETHTGRKVVAFMSANHVDPDLAAEIFVMEPSSNGAPVD